MLQIRRRQTGAILLTCLLSHAAFGQSGFENWSRDPMPSSGMSRAELRLAQLPPAASQFPAAQLPPSQFSPGQLPPSQFQPGQFPQPGLPSSSAGPGGGPWSGPWGVPNAAVPPPNGINSDGTVTSDLAFSGAVGPQSLNYFAGVGFNTDLGLFGRFVYDDRDFDWTAPPWRNPPVPWRGGGQHLRLEAMPGLEAQRYLVSFTQPYFAQFGGRPISFNVSGFYFDRDYFDWDETRYGGRFGFGYNLNRELSLSTKFRAENVEVSDPRLIVPEVERSLGDHELYAAGATLTFDNRDTPFVPNSGTYLELGFEQVFGSFEYPRASVDFRRYFWFRERPDRSGRHVIGLTFQGDITGSDTPVYDNYFAGGYSTLRGFRFRHASPKEMGVIVGGELSLLGSGEYIFPVTADDMVRGVFFCDLGTVEQTTDLDGDNFRLAVGGGLRINIPALGPAPLSIDAAVPLLRAPTDRVQNLSVFINVGY